MSDILEPRPMTIAEVADLVRRAGGTPAPPRPPSLTRVVGVLSMVTPAEKRTIDAAAKASGLTTSQWVRMLALERAGDERTLRLLAAAVRVSEAFWVDDHPDQDLAQEALYEAAFSFAESLSKPDRAALLRLARRTKECP